MTTPRHGLALATTVLILAGVTLSLAAEETATVQPEDVFTPPEGLEGGWYVRIETTMGRIIARLLPEQAPQSVAHFVGLSQGTMPWIDVISGETMKKPYYDGMRVHTVLAGRLFEAGDAATMGGSMPLLYVPKEGMGPLDFSMPYMMGMTRLSGGRISAVEFFVTVSPQPWLNGDSPCFGQVIEGRNVVFNISQAKSYSSRRPIEDIFIETIKLFKVGDPPPIPEPVPYTPKLKQVEFRGTEPTSE